MSRLAVVHAGRGRTSASGHLAERLLAAVCDASWAPVEASVVGVRDLMASLHDAVADGVWDVTLRDARSTILAADGVIAVTPIVHGAYSGPFKTFVDLMGPAWQAKPVLIGACGGTQRHCLALEHCVRPLFICLRSVPLPTAVFAAAGECEPGRVASDVTARIERAACELVAATTNRVRPPVVAVRGG